MNLSHSFKSIPFYYESNGQKLFTHNFTKVYIHTDIKSKLQLRIGHALNDLFSKKEFN